MQSFKRELSCNIYFYGLRGRQIQGPLRAAHTLYHLLQANIDRVDKKDILIIQGDWNAKVGTDSLKNWITLRGPSCYDITMERGLRLMDFSGYNNLVLANPLGIHKPSRRWTWRAPRGAHHNQIDYILVQNRFRSGVNRTKTRTFPDA